MIEDEIVKVCGCTRSYTQGGWAALDYVGQWDDGVDLVELRNCACLSTIAIRLGPSPTRKTDPAPPLPVEKGSS